MADRTAHVPRERRDRTAAARAAFEGVLREVFDGVAVLAGLAGALHRAAAAEGRSPASGELAAIRPTVLARLTAPGGVLAGTGVIAAPDVLADRSRWLEWWRLPHDRTGEPYPLSVDLDPYSVGGYEYPAAEWFEIPHRTGRRAVVGPYVDYAGTDEYILTFSAPVLGEAGFFGVAAADVRATDLERAALPLLHATGPGTLLVNLSGRVLASNTPAVVAGSLAPSGHRAGEALPSGEEWHECAGLPWSLVRTE
ncbi:cache domain-containing protein [Streptomyces sp. NPDC048172]|uniref:cache domain-containing protein n=1 Tax=Streptomyces sp. NPDC048172 TaxID=3365505 RepID=UPI00371DF0E3